jgi:hypothetical protein
MTLVTDHIVKSLRVFFSSAHSFGSLINSYPLLFLILIIAWNIFIIHFKTLPGQRNLKDTNLFSTLFPAHTDMLPILQNIRVKYGIQEFSPDVDDGLTEILINDGSINWQAAHREIKEQIRNHPELLPENVQTSETSPIANCLKILGSNRDF